MKNNTSLCVFYFKTAHLFSKNQNRLVISSSKQSKKYICKLKDFKPHSFVFCIPPPHPQTPFQFNFIKNIFNFIKT